MTDPGLPAGLRVYAIGDVHGCSELLESLLAKIMDELSSDRPDDARIIFLGDYIDRGPSSARVLAILTETKFPCSVVALRGNHEEMLLRFLDDAGTLAVWRRLGGLETLHSFGIDVAGLLVEADFQRAQALLRQTIPHQVVNFLAATTHHHVAGDYYFCHAGVRPGVPLEAQRQEDLLWIRDEFLRATINFGKIIVHGHTPVYAPEVFKNRINIDTGAYATGVLTAIVLEGSSRRFLATNQ